MSKTPGARSFGYLRQLHSGKWRASFTGPDGARHAADSTFITKSAGEAWLRRQETAISSAVENGIRWTPPEQQHNQVPTFAEYAETYLAQRTLKPRTIIEYRNYFKVLFPAFGGLKLDAITPKMIGAWYAKTCPGALSQRAHIYSLAHAIMRMAVREQQVTTNPFNIEGAQHVKRIGRTKLPSDVELALAVASMPPQYRLAIRLAAVCGLRSGELRALRRGDINLGDASVTVQRGVVQVPGGIIVSTPKTEKSTRTIPVPDWLVPAIREHLDKFVGPVSSAYVFSTEATPDLPLSQSALGDHWRAARETAGIPWCRLHDLRHYAGTATAIDGGAVEGEVRDFLGQSDVQVTRRYIDARQGRMREIVNRIPNFEAQLAASA